MTSHAGDGDSFARSCRSRGIPHGKLRSVTTERVECGRFPLLTCISGSIRILAFLVGTGYKMPFSEGFLLGATGPVGVQNVPFAGVFVPQEWNQHAYQSASRPCSVEVWIRLYHGVSASFHRFDSLCKLMYTSRTSPKAPKLPCIERRGAHLAPHPSLRCAHPAATLDEIQDGSPGEMGSSLNTLTGAYSQPLGSLKLVFSIGIRTARQAATPLAS